MESISFIGNISDRFRFATENSEQQIETLAQSYITSIDLIGGATLSHRNLVQDFVPNLVFVLNIISGLGFALCAILGMSLASTPIGCGSLILLGLLCLGLWYFAYLKKPNLSEESIRTVIKSNLLAQDSLSYLHKVMRTHRITFNDIYNYRLYDRDNVSLGTSNDPAASRRYATLSYYLSLHQQLKQEKQKLKRELQRTYQALTLPAPIMRLSSVSLYRMGNEGALSQLTANEVKAECRNITLERIKTIYQRDLAAIQQVYKEKKQALNAHFRAAFAPA